MAYTYQKNKSPKAYILKRKTERQIFKGNEITAMEYIEEKKLKKEDIIVLDKDKQVLQITIDPDGTARITGRHTAVL